MHTIQKHREEVQDGILQTRQREHQDSRGWRGQTWAHLRRHTGCQRCHRYCQRHHGCCQGSSQNVTKAVKDIMSPSFTQSRPFGGTNKAVPVTSAKGPVVCWDESYNPWYHLKALLFPLLTSLKNIFFLLWHVRSKRLFEPQGQAEKNCRPASPNLLPSHAKTDLLWGMNEKCNKIIFGATWRFVNQLSWKL